MAGDNTDISICRQLAERLQVPVPDVRRNSLLSSPCITGIASPTILLPSEIHGSRRLEKAFAHELAHLRRNDILWNLTQRLAVAVCFFQPLMWRLLYRLEATAEEVCDDFVVRHCLDRTGYAKQLVNLAESNLVAPNMAGLGMFSSRSMLRHRVVRILDSTRQLTTHVSFPMIATIVTMTISAAMLSGLIGNGTSVHSDLASASQTDNAATDGPPNVLGQASAANGTPDSNDEDANDQTISGVVVDTDGEPVGDVEVGRDEFRTQTDATGKFSVTLKKQAFGRRRVLQLSKIGYGKTYANLDEENPHTQRLTIIPDRHPIIGMLLDTEGNPVAGAEINVDQIARFDEFDLKQLLADAKEVGGERRLPESLRISGDGINPVTSAHDGSFTINGIGSGRLAVLSITGAQTALRKVIVATADVAPVEFSYLGLYTLSTGKETVHGRKIALVCEPSQPIVGRVLDSQTNQPVAGVVVASHVFASSDPAQQLAGLNHLKAVTDELGKFSLQGMPMGNGNQIQVSSPITGAIGPAVVTQTFEVPAGTGVDPIQIDLTVQAGAWLQGQVIDSDIGKPISNAHLNYRPYTDNQFANKLDRSHELFDRGWGPVTDKDGKFRLVATQGGAAIGLNIVNNNRYQMGQGWDEIPQNRISKDGILLTPDKRFTKTNPTAIKHVDVPPQGIDDLKFLITKGPSIRIKTIDPDGNPVKGVNVSYVPSFTTANNTTTETSEFEATGFSPGQSRTIWFQHREKRLGALVKVSAEDKSPFEVTLQPNGTVTAVLVNEKGEPDEKARLSFTRIANHRIVKTMVFPDPKQNENGNSSTSLMAGEYTFSIPGLNGFSGYKRIKLEPGETLNLGTIDITKKLAVHVMSRPGQNYIKDLPVISSDTPNPTAEPATDSKGDDAAPDGESQYYLSANSVSVTGRIHDRSGTPIIGAVVRFNHWKREPYRSFATIAETKSDDQGEFLLPLPEKYLRSLNLGESGADGAAIIVQAKGFGPAELACRDIQKMVGEPQKVELAPENRISGRVIDLEGSPVANAKVSVSWVTSMGKSIANQFVSKLNSAGDYGETQELLSDDSNLQLSRTAKSFDPIFIANSNGEFKITGMPVDALVSIQVEHPSITTMSAKVLNRKTATIDADSKYIVYGDQPNILTQPSRPVTGQVTGAESGQPVEGALVYCEEFGIESTTYASSPAPRALTDAEGKFELLGLPKSKRTRLCVFPPSDHEHAYLIKDVPHIPDTVGMQSVNLNIQLHRGIWLTGKVTDPMVSGLTGA